MTSGQKTLTDKIQNVLGGIVADGIDVHRCAAAIALGKIAHPDAGAVLKKALLDEDEDVRSDVVDALANLADPSTADAVMENFLDDPCPEVKLAAIEVLVKLNYQPLIPHLLKLVTSREDDEISWDDDAFYEGGWDDWLDIQFAVITALGELGVSDAVPLIIEALLDDLGQDISQIAIPALTKLGEPGMAALGKMLREGDARMRRRICSDLLLDQSSYSNDVLDKCLSDNDPEVREFAVNKLIDYSSSDSRLENFFDDPTPSIRAVVVKNIGTLYPEKTMSALNDKVPAVRKQAFAIIAESPDTYTKENFSEIVVAAIAGNPDVGGQAAVAWAALIGEPCAVSLGEALENTKQPTPFRLGLVEALSKLDEAGSLWLTKAAGDENRQVRISALEAIAKMAENNDWPGIAGQALLAALNGELVVAPEIPENSVDEDEAAESEIEDSDEAIAEAVDEPDQDEEAATEIIKPAAAVSTLEQMMSKGIQTETVAAEDYVEEEVILSEQDERFIELSKQRAMRKRKVSLDVKIAPHQDVRRYAARLLSNINQPGVIEALVEVLEVDDDELKIAVLDSLACLAEEQGGIEDIAFEPVLNETRHSDVIIKRLAIRCLGWVDAEGVEEHLHVLANDKDVHVRQEVIRSLGNMDVAREVLIDALNDDYSGIRISAARALTKNPDNQTVAQLVTLSLGFDGMHRGDIADMLAVLDTEQAGEFYLKVLADEKSKRVWRVAIDVLGDLFSGSPENNVSLAA